MHTAYAISLSLHAFSSLSPVLSPLHTDKDKRQVEMEMAAFLPSLPIPTGHISQNLTHTAADTNKHHSFHIYAQARSGSGYLFHNRPLSLSRAQVSLEKRHVAAGAMADQEKTVSIYPLLPWYDASLDFNRVSSLVYMKPFTLLRSLI
jgi:hypothetical protein